METSRSLLEIRKFIAWCVDGNRHSVNVLLGLGFTATDEVAVETDNGWVERKYTLD
jgi:hypothetical protein